MWVLGVSAWGENQIDTVKLERRRIGTVVRGERAGSRPGTERAKGTRREATAPVEQARYRDTAPALMIIRNRNKVRLCGNGGQLIIPTLNRKEDRPKWVGRGVGWAEAHW